MKYGLTSLPKTCSKDGIRRQGIQKIKGKEKGKADGKEAGLGERKGNGRPGRGVCIACSNKLRTVLHLNGCIAYNCSNRLVTSVKYGFAQY